VIRVEVIAQNDQGRAVDETGGLGIFDELDRNDPMKSNTPAPVAQSTISPVVRALAAAQKYLIFPCDPVTKAPLTKHGFKDASQSEVQIILWWSQHPDALIGVPTGAASGLDVVDVDIVKKPDAASSAWIEANGAHLASAQLQVTRSGGTHYKFKHDPAVDIGSRAGITTVEGVELKSIDTRGEGGYVIDWGAHGLPSMGTVQPMPAELAAQLHRSRKPRNSSLQIAPGIGLHPTQAAELPAALSFLDPSSYDTCRTVGMALQWLGGQQAFDIFHSFCAGEFTAAKQLPTNYGGYDWCAGKWDSYGKRPDREPVTLLSVFKLARNAGYSPAPIVTTTTIPPAPDAPPVALSVEMQALHPTVCAEILAAAPDTLFLANNHLEPNVAAERIFTYLGGEREMYRRGGAVVELDHEKRMISVSHTMFRSRLNKKGRKVRAFKLDSTGERLIHTPKLCSEDEAKLILATSAVECLPEIKLVTRMPVLVERNGALMSTRPGYNKDCGVLVTGNAEIPVVPLAEAVAGILNLLRDFRFNEPADKSRSLAGFISPGLRMGGLLHGDALINVMEADDSQAGKTLMQKLERATYGEKGYPVAQKKGGVGSFDESIAAAILSGSAFVNFDNLRGVVDSTYLEFIMTSGKDSVSVRVPHRGEVQVDIDRTSFQISSNGFHCTVDLSNRLLVTKILKQPGDYSYFPWPEGGILEHVEAHAAYYLGCVHAVIRHWYGAGKPRLPTEHTFKDWVGSLDWIVQNVFKAAPLMTGHKDTTSRISNPSLSWLRKLALEVLREGKAGQELRAGELREICERHSAMLPDGVKPSWEENAVERAIGKVLGACFMGGNTLNLDGTQVVRIEREERYEIGRVMRTVKLYVFKKA
jgi:hypothetical protein